MPQLKGLSQSVIEREHRYQDLRGPLNCLEKLKLISETTS
jgi:hypothetical protein